MPGTIDISVFHSVFQATHEPARRESRVNLQGGDEDLIGERNRLATAPGMWGFRHLLAQIGEQAEEAPLLIHLCGVVVRPVLRIGFALGFRRWLAIFLLRLVLGQIAAGQPETNTDEMFTGLAAQLKIVAFAAIGIKLHEVAALSGLARYGEAGTADFDAAFRDFFGVLLAQPSIGSPDTQSEYRDLLW